MRFLKRLLTMIYLYIGVFFTVCFIAWCITGEEPAALIAGVSAAGGVESLAAGLIRIQEIREERKKEKEERQYEKDLENNDTGDI